MSGDGALFAADVSDLLGLNSDERVREYEDAVIEVELRALVKRAAAANPRNTQANVGMSELAHPCLRRLGYRMAGVEHAPDSHDPWPAYVGTAVHAALAEAALADNERLGRERWLVEHKVTIYEETTGTVDLFDIDRGLVIDHKVLGATTHRKLVKEGPSASYRTQVQGYGFGLQLQGYDVRRVAIAAYPRSGMLRGLHVWSAPFDHAALEAPFSRHDAAQAAIGAGLLLAMLPKDTSECHFCPWYRPGDDSNPERICSGDTPSEKRDSE